MCADLGELQRLLGIISLKKVEVNAFERLFIHYYYPKVMMWVDLSFSSFVHSILSVSIKCQLSFVFNCLWKSEENFFVQLKMHVLIKYLQICKIINLFLF